jgi:hypothetical protein
MLYKYSEFVYKKNVANLQNKRKKNQREKIIVVGLKQEFCFFTIINHVSYIGQSLATWYEKLGQYIYDNINYRFFHSAYLINVSI